VTFLDSLVDISLNGNFDFGFRIVTFFGISESLGTMIVRIVTFFDSSIDGNLIDTIF
jgi:hypothetical protein